MAGAAPFWVGAVRALVLSAEGTTLTTPDGNEIALTGDRTNAVKELTRALVPMAAPERAELLTRLTAEAGVDLHAVLAQTMLTRASATEGPALLSLGAGEVRHIAPFGRKRSQGLKRLNEALQVLRLLWTAQEPVDFDGEFFGLKDAFIGNAGKERRRRHRTK